MGWTMVLFIRGHYAYSSPLASNNEEIPIDKESSGEIVSASEKHLASSVLAENGHILLKRPKKIPLYIGESTMCNLI